MALQHQPGAAGVHHLLLCQLPDKGHHDLVQGSGHAVQHALHSLLDQVALLQALNHLHKQALQCFLPLVAWSKASCHWQCRATHSASTCAQTAPIDVCKKTRCMWVMDTTIWWLCHNCLGHGGGSVCAVAMARVDIGAAIVAGGSLERPLGMPHLALETLVLGPPPGSGESFTRATEGPRHPCPQGRAATVLLDLGVAQAL